MGKLVVFNKEKRIMKKWTEVTQEEYEQLKDIKSRIDWNKDQMAGVVNISLQYINPATPSCLSCSHSFRETLNNVRSFYLLHKDEWELKFDAAKVAEEMHKPKTNGKAKTK
jgi:hypothetical protein